MIFRSTLRAVTISAVLSVTALSVSAAEIIVPHYAAPGFVNNELQPDWQQLVNAAHADYRITTVFNPANGPGTAQNADFLQATTEYRACGACSDLLGFVATRLNLTTLRPIADVKSEIDRYYAWYPVTGIFLDELPSEAEMFTVTNGTVGPSANRDTFLSYYSELYAYIKGKSNQFDRVIANPGTRTDEAFLIGGTGANGVRYGQAADALTVFENTYAVLTNGTYVPTPWNTARDYSDQLGYLVHTTGATVDLGAVISTIRGNGADIVYITDGCEPGRGGCLANIDSRYNQLPTYWDSLLTTAGEVCVVPEPGSFALVMAGLAAIGFSRRRNSRLAA